MDEWECLADELGVRERSGGSVLTSSELGALERGPNLRTVVWALVGVGGLALCALLAYAALHWEGDGIEAQLSASREAVAAFEKADREAAALQAEMTEIRIRQEVLRRGGTLEEAGRMILIYRHRQHLRDVALGRK